MGRRKKEAANMGKALIKDRFRGKTVSRGGESFLHTTEINDGLEGRSVNLRSLTEQTSMADFLLTAEMADRDFTAEKENVQLVTPQLTSGLLSKEELQKVKETQDMFKSLLRIPRRPPWTESMPADKLRQEEQLSFLDWRRQLARLQEEEHIVITPYEKNLEFWRQLWRVIERSDVVAQIVDARNPLLFWCRDLDTYVREVDPRKETLLLINKADLLTVPQRQAWAEYFASQGVHAVFWSAVEEADRVEREKNTTLADDSPADEERDTQSDASADDIIAADDVKCQDLHHIAEPQRTSDEMNDDKNDDDDDGRKSVEDLGLSAQSVSSHNAEKSESSDTVVKIVETSEPKNENHSKEMKDTQIKISATEHSCIDKDDDSVEACESNDNGKACEGDNDDNSDDYDTIEEYTDDEGEEELAECSGDGIKTGKAVCDIQMKTEDSGNRVCSETAASGQSLSSEPKPVSVADGQLQTSEELLVMFRRVAKMQHQQGVTTVGMVGYPNVGKSSTINTILHCKKVAVSATPGRTKHFQTLYVDRDLMLCDCPGLVFPSFVNSKADLVVNGILPIDQLQDSEPPVELVCQHVGRSALEALYHLNLPPPEEWEDPDTPPSAVNLLQAYGALRGFMSHKGNPDRSRAARYVLKDYVSGKLLFCHPPPGIDAAAFQKPPYGASRPVSTAPKASNRKTESQMKSEALAEEFFNKVHIKAHAIGPHAVSNHVRMEGLRPVGAGQVQGQSQSSESSTPQGSQTSVLGKPWKRHNNRNKKEKLRRVYKSLDAY